MHNWKRVLGIFVLLAAVVGLAQVIAVRAAPTNAEGLTPLIVTSSRHATSAPLREKAQRMEEAGDVKAPEGQEQLEIPTRLLPKALSATASSPSDLYSILQASPGVVDAMPLPIHNFEGLNNLNGVLPPDTNGDVGYDPVSGKKYYMQWVNLSLAVWDVTDPNNVTMEWGPVNGNVLFDGFGGPCENTNDGDPIVLFDQFEDRWVTGQFALPNFPSAPYYQCMAVSATADPTGAWHLYEFEWPVPKMNDYPKLGVWTDGIYITANQFANNASNWGGAGVGAFDKMAMYNGDPATFVFFDLFDVDSDFGGMLPADLDGSMPPPGTPNFFAEWDDSAWLGDAEDTIRIWEFHVDWNSPASSTFGLSGLPNAQVETADVDPDMCAFDRNCIPLPGGTPVDAISDRLMFRLAYRYHEGHHVLVSNHTVDVGGDHAGIHWFELRSDGNQWNMHQEGVYAPDSDHRWMGSAAMDGEGNIAVGFSVASATTFPSVRYAGRLAGDPLGQLAQGEAEIIAGAGYQEHSSGRWGDYSSINIDPTDDCTFWYTQEYYGSIGTAPWQTRVGSFKFPNCTAGPQGWLNGTVTDGGGSPIEGARVEATASVTQTYGTSTNANGIYTLTLPVGTVDATAWKYGYLPASVNGIDIISGTVTTQDFMLSAATIYTVDGYVRDTNTGWPLYAAIAIDGYPGAPVWTDPVTGYYSISLAAGMTYTIHADAWADGYLPDMAVLPELSADETVDLYLDVDSLACTAPGYRQDFDYFEDFDSDDGGWTNSSTVWEWGEPTSGPGAAYSEPNLWATNLSGPYPNDADDYLTSPAIDMSGYAGMEFILAWWQYYDGENCCDYISVEVSNDGGTNWTTVYGPYDGADVTEQEWEQQMVVLDGSYAVSDLQVRFHFESDFSVTYPGWYVDNIGIDAVDAGTLLWVEDFEGDDAGYAVAGATSWEWGVPTSGPGAAHSGTSLWATNLSGNYSNNEAGTLTSPAIDLSAYAGKEFSLRWWQYYDGENCCDYISVEVSNDGGATWTEVYGPYDGGDVTEQQWTEQRVNLDSSYAVSDFHVRFYFDSDGSVNYPGWYVDDVALYETSGTPTIACVPQDGGLVVGFVYDENTGMPLPDATVYHDLDQVDTGYTPDDTDMDDGFYTIWAPPGPQVVTATLMNSFYGIDVESVNVVQSDTVQADFYLPAAWVTNTPDSFSAVLEMGQSDTSQLMLENIGALPTYWEITELNGGRDILLPFDPLPDVMVKPFRSRYPSTEGLSGIPDAPEAAPFAAGDIIQSWIPTESLPNPWSIAYDASNDSVWVGEGWGNDMLWEYTPAGVYTGRSYNFPWSPTNGPADAAYNWNTGMLWIMNVTSPDNCIYEIDPDSGFTGNLICPGGGSGFATSQRGLAYDPASDTFFAGSWNDLMVYRFATDGTILAQVNTGLAISGLAYNPDTMHLFAMTNDDPNMVYVLDVDDNYNVIGSFLPDQGFAAFSGAGLEFDCDGNLWAVDQDTDTVYQMESGEEAVLCDRDVPWVSTDPVSGTLGVGGSTMIDVTLDASAVDQPGDYYALLKVTTETPYEDIYVPLTMTVPAPPAWGKLEGYVEGMGRCDADTDNMLDMATVYIEASNGMTATIETDHTGYFEWWMDAGTSSPVTITVSYPGYVDQTIDSISLQAGEATTEMVDLRLDAPCASTTPDSLSVTVIQGMTETQYLTVKNSGAGLLDYMILETDRTLPYGPEPVANVPAFSAPAPVGPSSIRSQPIRNQASEVEAPESDWYAALDMPGGIVRYAHAQCFESPNSFYVIGGVDENFGVSDKTWRYDGDTNTWTELAPIPAGSEGPTAVCYWGKIYVMGGDGTDNFFIYDIASDEWMSAPEPLPRPVAGAAAGAWDGMIYLAGGDDDFTPSTGVSAEINVFDIDAGSWLTTVYSLPVGTSFPGYQQLDNDLYVVGGWGEMAPMESVTVTARINLMDGNVTTGPTFESARSDFALGATNEALYAIGGDADGGGFFDAERLVERLDLSAWPNGAWTDLEDPLPVPRTSNSAGFCTSVLFDSELRSVGGYNPNTGVVSGDNRFMAAPGETCFGVYDDVPWVEPLWMQNMVAADSSEMVPVVFDATGLAPGTYDANLLLVNNDPPLAQEFIIPVSMEVVTAVQSIDVSVDSTMKDAPPGSIVTYTVTMTNTGNAAMTLHMTAGAHKWLMIMPDHTLTLQPGESDVMYVRVYIPLSAAIGAQDTVEVMVMMDDTMMHSMTLTTTASAGPGVMHQMYLPVIIREE